MQDFAVCFVTMAYIIVVCKKWPENSRALTSNVQVGNNWYLAIIGPWPVIILHACSGFEITIGPLARV